MKVTVILMQVFQSMETNAPPIPSQIVACSPFISLGSYSLLWHIELKVRVFFPRSCWNLDRTHVHCVSVHLRWAHHQITWPCFGTVDIELPSCVIQFEFHHFGCSSSSSSKIVCIQSFLHFGLYAGSPDFARFPESCHNILHCRC